MSFGVLIVLACFWVVACVSRRWMGVFAVEVLLVKRSVLVLLGVGCMYEGYSNRSHLGLIIRYNITGPSNPAIAAVVFIPTVMFIMNMIAALAQIAKNAHFFHLNRKITNTALAKLNRP